MLIISLIIVSFARCTEGEMPEHFQFTINMLTTFTYDEKLTRERRRRGGGMHKAPAKFELIKLRAELEWMREAEKNPKMELKYWENCFLLLFLFHSRALSLSGRKMWVLSTRSELRFDERLWLVYIISKSEKRREKLYFRVCDGFEISARRARGAREREKCREK